MAQIDETRLLVKMARMYYQHEMTQAQIAARVGMSRQKVQRLLRKSRETGVVHILIKPTADAFQDLEMALEERYGLKDAVVTETENYDKRDVVTLELAAAAAQYLCRVIRSQDRIAVTWGGTIGATIDALYHHPRPNVRNIAVIQGFGGLGDANDTEHITFLTQRLAAWVGGRGYIIPAPALAGSVQARKAFCSDSSIATVFERARSANLLITGIGRPAAADRFMKMFSPRHPELRGMPMDNVAGDINLRFFDDEGNRIVCDFDDRIIGLNLAEIRKIDMVVSVAGGAEKFKPILAALRGRIINVLVTDHISARKLLDAPHSQAKS